MDNDRTKLILESPLGIMLLAATISADNNTDKEQINGNIERLKTYREVVSLEDFNPSSLEMTKEELLTMIDGSIQTLERDFDLCEI